MTTELVLGSVILIVSGLSFFVLKRRKEISPNQQVALGEKLDSKNSGLITKLSKTRGALFEKLSLLSEAGKKPEAAEWNHLEEILLEADVGFPTTQTLLEKSKDRLKLNPEKPMIETLKEVAKELFNSSQINALKTKEDNSRPLVISLVGVNGAGKTTTVGKLAQKFRNEEKSVLLGAIDTFRAGAISQLKVWAERTGSQFVTGREGADPGAVAFDSVTAATARNVDITLLDTAGRLHTKANLMEELKKIHRVVKKVIPEAPHETWLVIDGTLGQNSVAQAREFQKALELTGVVVTKLDGTAKGGAVLSIASDLKLPVKYIGVGESVEDLVPFEPEAFIEAILG